MSTKDPKSPDRSNRNAEGKDATAFYEESSQSSQFGGGQFWGMQKAGIIEDTDDEVPESIANFVDEGVTVDEAFKADIIACVTLMRTDGKAWHVSNVNSATRNSDGSSSIDLVLCSGDLCCMKKFSVTANGKAALNEKATFDGVGSEGSGAFNWA
jgi:hypothetical protein